MGVDRTTGDAVISAIENAEFPPGSRRSGYDEWQVDAFLDRLADACRAGWATPAKVDQAEFSDPPRFRRGYDRYAVDAFLDDLRDLLAHGPEPEDDTLPACPESLHRRPVWRGIDGGLPRDALTTVVAEQAARDALLIGCRADGLAPELNRWVPGGGLRVLDPWTEVGLVGLDQPDASLDLVCAPWTLHLAVDLDRILGDIARALRPHGVLVATADSDQHLADLWALAGHTPPRLAFGPELAPDLLQRHFADVERIDVETRASLRTRDEAYEHLAWSSTEVADQLPEFMLPAEYAGHTSLFIATPAG